MSEIRLSQFHARDRTIQMVKDMCGTECKKLFLPMCKDDHWGYFGIEVDNEDAIWKGSYVSWGRFYDDSPDQFMLNGIVHILTQCFPRV